MVEINRRIEEVRFANERFTHTNENVVEVKVNSIYEEPTPMDLNAGGLVEAIKQGIIISAKRPVADFTERLLIQLMRIKFDDSEKIEMSQKITEIVGDEYAELVCRAIELE